MQLVDIILYIFGWTVRATKKKSDIRWFEV